MSNTLHKRLAHNVLVLFVLASVGFAPTAAYAEYRSDALPSTDVFGDFVVGPGKVELTLNPGESKTVEVTLANRMGDDRKFDLTVEDMKGSDNPEQTVVLLGDDRGPYSLRDYFSVPEWSFMLPHARKARIPVTVTIPADAEPGGYYGSVLFTTTSKPNEQGGQGAAAIISRIGVLFFVTVPGAGTYEGKLESFSSKNTFFTEGPIPFQMLFRNTGNMHLNPSGEITIRNMIGTQVETLVVEPWFALPGSLRLREVEWNRAALMGRYTAEAAIKRDYGDQVDRMTVTFWVIPVVPAAIALGGIFVLFFIIRFIATNFEFKRKR
jgi:hypothetical protein